MEDCTHFRQKFPPLTEAKLTDAIAYLKNEHGVASRDNYVRLDEAMAAIINAGERLLDLSQDIDVRIVPLAPADDLLVAGKQAGQSAGDIFSAMAYACRRDERLPTTNNSFGYQPPF